jgi:DNA repair protein RadC
MIIYELEEIKVVSKSKIKVKDRKIITTSFDVEKYLRYIYKNSINIDDISLIESFICLYLNQGNKILGHAVISKGGISACSVDVRVILQKALLVNASGLILCHNHPSGNLKVSDSDKKLTTKIVEASKLLDIKVLDHIILSPDDNEYFSFQDNELLLNEK